MKKTMQTDHWSALAHQQRQFFLTHQTKNPEFRKHQLSRLYEALEKYSDDIEEALFRDIHKPHYESYFEIGIVQKEIRYHQRKLKKWASPSYVRTPLFLQVAKSYVVAGPYGRVLILAPWNYPVLLLLSPLVGAISAGNCVTLKPSGRLPELNRILEQMFHEYFDPAHIALATGGHNVSQAILDTPFDYIFFTGSQDIGKTIMKKASETLTPCTLELGGKNPCIVWKDANPEVAARRISWGKFLNGGQTFVAPDYVLVHRSIQKPFIQQVVRFLKQDYGEEINDARNLMKLISQERAQKLLEEMKEGKIIAGGYSDPENRFIGPTLLEVDPEAAIMQEEIFGPVLPVIPFDHYDEVFSIVSRHPNPLALYLFTSTRKVEHEILKNIPSGGVSINDVVLQFTNNRLPFGGKKESGIGTYHGYHSFKTFSHYRSVYKKWIKPDFQVRYLSYTKKKKKILRWLLR